MDSAKGKQSLIEAVFITLKHDYRVSATLKELEPGGEFEEYIDCYWDSQRNSEECSLQIALEKISRLINEDKKSDAAEIITRIELLAPYLLSRELISSHFHNFLNDKIFNLKERLLY